jgi:hypothetical protein
MDPIVRNRPVTGHMFFPSYPCLSFTFHRQMSTLYTVINLEMPSGLLHLEIAVKNNGEFQPQCCGLKADLSRLKISFNRLLDGRKASAHARSHTHTHAHTTHSSQKSGLHGFCLPTVVMCLGKTRLQ